MREMREKINLLKGLPKGKKPLKIRSQATKKDRNHHWALDKGYFDGTREQGYGGYKYDGRWKPVAKDIIKHYSLKDGAKVLDIGCAKGFLIYDIINEFPKIDVWGVDISTYAINFIDERLKSNIIVANAKELPFDSNSFDLVLSINSLHNILNVNETIDSLSEIQRVSKKEAFVSLGAYKNDIERETLDNWAVVATTYASEEDWIKIFDKAGYTGDYWWFKPN